MISFFRNALSSKLVLGFFALIMLAFIVTGVGTDTGGVSNLVGSASRVAKIGSASLDAREVLPRINIEFEAAREQQPGLELKDFAASGRVDEVINAMIDGRALEEFARRNDMVASPRLIDAEIAGVPAFKGATGNFDRQRFEGFLQQRGLTEAGLRGDIARDKLATMMIIPAGGAARVPVGLVTPYASLLLEGRKGEILEITASALPRGAEPTTQELETFYARNTARYTIPERRVVRYALFDRSRFKDAAQPTAAELQAAYAARSAEFSGKETRVITQVIVQDQAAATALAAKVRGGTAMTAASPDATTLAAQDKSGLTSLTAAAVADAAFAAKQGDVAGPVKSSLGWHVLRVDAINKVAGQSLDQVRGTLSATIIKEKTERLFADFVTKIDDAVANGATFDDVVKSEKLIAVTTPEVTAGGKSVSQPGYVAPPELEAILKEAFQADADDEATVIPVAGGSADALVDLDTVVPAKPQPFAAIRAQVLSEFLDDRAHREAKRLAETIAAKARSAGFAAAVSGAGVALPATRPLSARRIQIAQAQGKAPPEYSLLFSMARKSAKVLEMPGKKGWQVVWLDAVIPGNIAEAPELVAVARQQMVRALGEEYVAQFVGAVKADLAVARYPDAVTALKKGLTGQPAQ